MRHRSHEWRRLGEYRMAIKIVLTNVMVSDQTTAHHFYTEVLGFQVKNDVHMGAARWLDRKSTRLNSSHSQQSRMPSSA